MSASGKQMGISLLLVAIAACSGGNDGPSQAECDQVVRDIAAAAQRDGRSTNGICLNPPKAYEPACAKAADCRAHGRL